jgi:hypothetical protein
MEDSVVTGTEVDVEAGRDILAVEETLTGPTTQAAIAGAQSKISVAVAKQDCSTALQIPVGSRHPKYWEAQKAWLASGAVSHWSCWAPQMARSEAVVFADPVGWGDTVEETGSEVEVAVALLVDLVAHSAIAGAQSKISVAVAKQDCSTALQIPVGSRHPKY